jgi:hypothetical protein
MTTCGNGGDLLCNFSLSGSMLTCHTNFDLLTTITGDLALTKDDEENNRQRLLMWMATPKGERINPATGCCLHDYFHEKMTGSIYRRLELDLKTDLKSVFPTLDIKNLSVDNISDLESGNRTIQVGITLGDDSLKFVADFNSLVSFNDTINSLIYYGGASTGTY